MKTNAEQHGPSCAETPIDHRCGDSEQDQGVTWSQWTRIQSERLQRIASLHVKTDAGHGATTGYCAECDRPWPCQTVHITNGWGDGENDCYATGWCHHAGVKVENIYGGGKT